MGKRKGNNLELYSTPICNIPLVDINNSKHYEQIVEKVDDMINTIKEGRTSCARVLQEDIDKLVYEEYNISEADRLVIERTGVYGRGDYEV